jgi:hypothetical protein
VTRLRVLFALFALFAVLGCGPSLRSVVGDYRRAMTARDTHAEYAAECFEDVKKATAELLAEGRLAPVDRLVVAGLRVRACVETGDDAGADATIAAEARIFASLDPDARWPGDVAGNALLSSAARKDPDRALADLVTAEERVTGARALAFIDLRKVRALIAKGTPKARELAVSICETHKDDARFEAAKPK